MKLPEEFKKEREYLNELVKKYSNLDIKRFYNLDGAVYREGRIPAKYKELLGLVAAMVLRCDDCIRYHLIKCYKDAFTEEDKYLLENIARIVGDLM